MKYVQFLERKPSGKIDEALATDSWFRLDGRLNISNLCKQARNRMLKLSLVHSGYCGYEIRQGTLKQYTVILRTEIDRGQPGRSLARRMEAGKMKNKGCLNYNFPPEALRRMSYIPPRKIEYVIKDNGFKNRYAVVYAENDNQALSLGSSYLGTCNCRIVKLNPDNLVKVGMIWQKVA